MKIKRKLQDYHQINKEQEMGEEIVIIKIREKKT